MLNPPRDVALLDTARGWANASCAPLWWDEPERASDCERRKVGTVCLVDTGSRLIGITAQHVHRQLAARLQSGRTSVCQLGGTTFDPLNRLIDEDEQIDLATYDLTPIVVASSGHREWRAPNWPPPSPELGKACAVGGYPFQLSNDIRVEGNELTPTERREFKFLCYYVKGVADLTPRRVTCDIDPDNSPSWTEQRFPAGTLFDGMSGGPFIQFSQSLGLLTFSLRAVVVERAFGQTVCRPLSIVLEDGHLDRTAW